MDKLPLQVILIPFISGALAWGWYYVIWRKRRDRAKPASDMATEQAPAPSQPWGWMLAGLACLAAIVLVYSPWTSWYLSRHPPVVEHRAELVETAAKELRCPAEQLAIKPSGDSGAQVQGCQRTIGLCWGKLVGHRSRVGWSVAGCNQP